MHISEWSGCACGYDRVLMAVPPIVDGRTVVEYQCANCHFHWGSP